MANVEDERVAFVEAVMRLQRGPEPAELIYSADLPLLHTQPGAHAAAAVVAEGDSGDEGSEAGDATRLFTRRVATVMARLSVLAQPATQQTMTPRAVLEELTDIVRHGLFLALPPSMRRVGSEWHSLSAAFHVYVSSRRVPMAAMVDGLCTVAYTSAKLRVELVVAQLRQRLRHELQAQRGADAAALAALLVTQTLLDDFAEIYGNLLLVVPLCHRLARLSDDQQQQQQREDGAAGTSQMLCGLQPAMVRYYYQLADWVLRVGNAATVPPLSLTKVSHVFCDEKSGTVTAQLHRPAGEVPWGLLFSEQGTLIDIDVAMRVHGRANELHQLLLSTGQGAHVVAVNDKPLRLPRGEAHTSHAAGSAGNVHEVLRAIATLGAARKTMKLRLTSPAFRAAVRRQPQEMAFIVMPQGNEASAGQRVSLLLHRHVPQLPWPFVVREADLRWQVGPTRGFSAAARDFLARHTNRLRLWAINGVELSSAAQAHALAESVETVLLDLVVTGRAGGDAVRPTRQSHTAAPSPHHHHQQQQLQQEGAPQQRGGKRQGGGQAVADAVQLQESVLAATPAAAYYPPPSPLLPEQEQPSSSSLPLPTNTVGTSLAQQQPAATAVGVRRRSAAQTIKAAARTVRGKAATVADEAQTMRGAASEEMEEAMRTHGDGRTNAPAPTAQTHTTRTTTTTAATREVEETAGMQAQAVAATSSAAQHRSSVVEQTRRRVQRLQQRAAQPVTHDAVPGSRRGKAAHSALVVTEEAKTTSKAARGTASRAADKTHTPRTSTTAAAATVGDAAKTVAKSTKIRQPLKLRNHVRICALDENTMVLERPSTSQPWGLSIEHHKSAAKNGGGATRGPALRLLSLPAAPRGMTEHPFMRIFGTSPSTWYIDRVNGKRNNDAEAMLRYMSSLTRMTLHFLRK